MQRLTHVREGNPFSSFVAKPAALIPSNTSRSVSSNPRDKLCGVRRYARTFAD